MGGKHKLGGGQLTSRPNPLMPESTHIFVGDSEVDAMAAQTAGVAFVVVLSGDNGGGGVRRVSGEGRAGVGRRLGLCRRDGYASVHWKTSMSAE